MDFEFQRDDDGGYIVDAAGERVRNPMYKPWDKYVATYYWGFTILTTVGFGDISGAGGKGEERDRRPD